MSKKKRENSTWYPVSTLGVIFTVLYAMVPPYIAYANTTETFPRQLNLPLIGGMSVVLASMLICRYTNQKPFQKKAKK